MMILDCESFQSALDSSAAILRMDSVALFDVLRDFEYEQIPEHERHERPYDDLLVWHCIGIDPFKLPPPPGVHWFHATRVPPTTTFQDGILPLSSMLHDIWVMLGKLASDWVTPNEWQDFRKDMRGRGAEMYHLKLSHGVIGEGPFAFLVRDVILRPNETWSHDYLYIPEIIEAICTSFQDMYGRPLRERYLNATKPCIVKFFSDDRRSDALKAALMYIHRYSRKEKLNIDCNTCFSGEGIPVTPDAIKNIEWIEYSDA